MKLFLCLAMAVGLALPACVVHAQTVPVAPPVAPPITVPIRPVTPSIQAPTLQSPTVTLSPPSLKGTLPSSAPTPQVKPATQAQPAAVPTPPAGIPGGIWVRTCTRVEVMANQLRAQCLNSRQQRVAATLTLPCRSNNVVNQDGKLACK